MPKIFETGRIRSPKKRMFKALRYFRGVGMKHFGAFPRTDADEDLGQAKSLNVQAYIIANQLRHEIESQKAMLTSLSRHDKWKAGGPV